VREKKNAMSKHRNVRPAGQSKKLLFDDASEVTLSVNQKYAERYENKKRDEELSRCRS
jgi:hypothetical protein